MEKGHEIEISVIIPIYNVEQYLPECLDSVVGQSFKDFEAICVIDGATDRSEEILREYMKRDERIILIYQENQGVAAARNAGIDKAQGKYLYFLDSDDKLAPDALREMHEKIVREDLDLLMFETHLLIDQDYRDRGEANREYYEIKNDYPGIYTGTEYLIKAIANDEHMATVWTKLIKKSLLQINDINFYPGIEREDELFTIKLLYHAKRVGMLRKKLYYHRIRNDSIMQANRSFSQAHGCFVGFMEIVKLLERDRDKYTEDKEIYYSYAKTLLRYARQVYAGYLSQEEKDKYLNLPPAQRTWFEAAVVEITEANEVKANLKKKYNSIKNSRAYRMGKAITWPAKVLRGAKAK